MPLSEKFSRLIEEDSKYRKAKEIVSMNAKEDIWLVGGQVYRNLANILYGIPIPQNTDFDFIIETQNQELVIPWPWNITRNHFGDLKIRGPNYNIDLIPLTSIHIQSIENYLKHVPLTIQSIAYNIKDRRLIGEIGMKALYDKKVEVNSYEDIVLHAKIYQKTLTEIIEETAQSIGFTPITRL